MNHDPPHGGGSREGGDFQNNVSNHTSSPLDSGLGLPPTGNTLAVPGLAQSPHLSPAISPGSASNHVNVGDQQIKTEVKAEPGEGGPAQLVESSTMQVIHICTGG